MERDGMLFHYILSYLRDGKVCLPYTVPRQTLIDELSYYGVEAVDREDISREMTARACMDANQSMNKVIQMLKEESDYLSSAVAIIESFLEKCPSQGCKLEYNIKWKCLFPQKTSLNQTFSEISTSDLNTLKAINKHLKRAGLKVKYHDMLKKVLIVDAIELSSSS